MAFFVYLGIHIILCVTLVGLVLLQQGRGADLGAAFSGASNTIFGAGGADRLIVRLTTIVAILFMVSTIVLVNTFSFRAQNTPVAAPASELASELVGEIAGGANKAPPAEEEPK